MLDDLKEDFLRNDQLCTVDSILSDTAGQQEESENSMQQRYETEFDEWCMSIRVTTSSARLLITVQSVKMTSNVGCCHQPPCSEIHLAGRSYYLT